MKFYTASILTACAGIEINSVHVPVNYTAAWLEPIK